MLKRKYNRYFFQVCLLVFIGSFQACKKDNSCPEIPYAYININLDPNSPLYLELNTIGGWLYLVGNSPSRGIIIYRKASDEFVAFERTCPFDPEESKARIMVEATGVTAIDSVCMSRFLLLDGTPFNGPSQCSLKQYQTYYNGNTLQIYSY